MAIETTISQLTSDDVQTIESTIVEMLLDVYPSLDLTRGRVLRDVLIRPASILHALNNKNIDALRRSMSLQEIEADPTIADDDTVDQVLSNFLMERNAAVKASGNVTIVISALVTTSIVGGTTFRDGLGNLFVTEATYTGVTTAASVISSTDRLIYARSDGRFTFTIPVVAQTAGYIAIKRDTRFTLSPSPTILVDAYAESDFSPGRNEETNDQLIARLSSGITAQILQGRAHITSLLKANFPNILDVSCVGFGDSEMNRDRRNIFAISQGGKSDIYVRTSAVPLDTVVVADATLVDKPQQIWEVSLDRNTVPGFYKIVSIIATDRVGAMVDSLEVVSETRSLSTADDGSGFTPSLSVVSDAVYSRYQAASVQFRDPETAVSSLSLGAKKSYTLTISVMPQIRDVQDFVNKRDRRATQADYLVRAPIPCYVSAEIVVRRPVGSTIDTAALKNAAAAAINAITFKFGRLPSSVIVDAIQELLPTGASVQMPLHLIGRIRKPDGVTDVLHATDALYIPVSNSLSVSNRTTTFFASPTDIGIELQDLTIQEA